MADGQMPSAKRIKVPPSVQEQISYFRNNSQQR